MIKWREKKNTPESSKRINLRGKIVKLHNFLNYF